MPERDVHLLLSQKAARLLEDALIEVKGDENYDPDGVYSAILNDLQDQIEPVKKKKSKRKKDTR